MSNSGGSANKHLPRRDHRRREFFSTRFDQHIRIGGRGRADDDADAAPESHDALEIEQLRADDRDATEREQSAEHALPFQSLLRQIKMSEDESETLEWSPAGLPPGRTRHIARPRKAARS